MASRGGVGLHFPSYYWAFYKAVLVWSGRMAGYSSPSELCLLTCVVVFLTPSHAVLCKVLITTLAHFPVGLFLLYLLNTSFFMC